jgi:hypothetical protein
MGNGNGSIDVKRHIDAFRAERSEVGTHQHSLFILFGKDVARFFTKHLAEIYPNHVRCKHYSARGTDAEWVEQSWTTLQRHYAATRASFNTLEFVRNDLMTDQLHTLKDKQNAASQSRRGRRSPTV